MNKCIIGHASISENGSINGKKGDQNGKEVCTREWYNKPWIAVFRPIDVCIAEKIASSCEKACKNDNIGYSQDDRYSLYNQLRIGISMDSAKLCNCDCSSLVSACLYLAGIKVSPYMYTGNEAEELRATKQFYEYTTSQYIDSSYYLKRGDILLSKGHTAIVLSNNALTFETRETSSPTADYANDKDILLTGTYKTLTTCYMRKGASINKPIIKIVPSNRVVACYGYYNFAENRKWLLCQYVDGGISYVGYISENCISKN